MSQEATAELILVSVTTLLLHCQWIPVTAGELETSRYETPTIEDLLDDITLVPVTPIDGGILAQQPVY